MKLNTGSKNETKQVQRMKLNPKSKDETKHEIKFLNSTQD